MVLVINPVDGLYAIPAPAWIEVEARRPSVEVAIVDTTPFVVVSNPLKVLGSTRLLIVAFSALRLVVEAVPK